MASSTRAHSLSALQRELLDRFFAREQSFFLSGGAALVGFYLGHRTTSDLDLFTAEPAAWERAPFLLGTIAREVGAVVETKQDAPDFRRQLVSRPDEAVLVDLVFDRSPPLVFPKPARGDIRLDPPEEILANKLTTLVSRSEERDLVDVMCLERAGYRVEDALGGALSKDGGCTPGQLAYVLDQITIPAEAQLPGDIPPAELRHYLADLIARLQRAAHPVPGTR